MGMAVGQVEPAQVSSAICLRACYAVSDTAIAYDAISLCACYPMFGTDIAYAAIGLCEHYAMSGTEIAHGGRRRRSHVPENARCLVGPS
eukprot:2987739-Rhodomonas_salina.2